VSVAVSESSPPVSIGAQCSPQFGPVSQQPPYHQHHLQPRAADDQRAVTNDHNMMSILKQLEQGRDMQAELQEVIADLQVHVFISPILCLFLEVHFSYMCIMSVILSVPLLQHSMGQIINSLASVGLSLHSPAVTILNQF